MESANLTDTNIDKIATLFPNCVTETADDNGKLKKAINFDMLRAMLSEDIFEGNEAYEFTWVGKKAAITEANRPIRKTLRPCVEESVNWDTTENLYIEGDNLEVLKLLQENYLGKIKMVYIDPPYNTGNDFIYDDDFSKSRQEFDKSTGSINDAGERLVKNVTTNGRFHSDWCSMIYSRLLLARNLLSDDGVIFISIDDNEQENLKKICDEVLGSENFITQFIWEKTQHFGRQKINYYSNCEYVFCYAKKIFQDSSLKELLVEYVKTDFLDAPLFNASNPENEIEFPARSVIFKIPDGEYNKSTAENFTLINTVTVKNGTNENTFKLRFKSRWSNSKVIAEFHKGTRYLIKSTNFSVRAMYAEGKVFNESPKQLIFTNPNNPRITKNRFGNKVGTNEEGSSELNQLGIVGFSYPKPASLIEYLLSLCVDSDYTVLDFFSGSATTAQAVMQLNAQDNGRRKYILVQIPEKTDENSEAYKAGYKNICEIGKERIRRAGAKIKSETGADIDYGFRVLKLDDSNMKDIYYSPSEIQQHMLASLESNIKPDRNDLDLLFGCLLDWGLPLTMSYSTEEIDGCSIHNYNDGDLIACFNDEVPESIIKYIADKKPLRALFRDSCFKDSPDKINVSEIFKQKSPDTKIKII